MSETDKALDSALAALHGSVSTDEDDARFAKRIAAGLSNFAPTSRRDLDSVLGAPFPDDHHDLSDEDFAHEASRGDDHHAASAADAGDVRGWEGSMSEDDRPPNSMSGLAGLTRSGPHSHANADAIDGAAKGDDSGLIDLRAMSQSEAAPAAEPAAKHDSGSISLREPTKPAAAALAAAAPASVKPVAAVAAVAPAAVTPAVAAAPAAVAPKKEEKKKGAGLWIALGGLAAAAAVAAVVIPMSHKSAEAPTAQANEKAAAEKSDDKKKDEAAKVAVAPAATAAASEAPAASASAANDPDPAATVAAAPTGGYGGSAPKAMQGTPGAVAAKAGPDKGNAAPDPKAPPPAPSTDPIKKPAGGSLDDVLGIGKNEPVAKKADPNENLPDKPDSMDVRSAINGKVGAARACVKGHSEASSVSVTFGPGGGVSGVVVTSGEAKGTGAEACIKGAFATAKVPPSKKGASGSAVLQP